MVAGQFFSPYSLPPPPGLIHQKHPKKHKGGTWKWTNMMIPQKSFKFFQEAPNFEAPFWLFLVVHKLLVVQGGLDGTIQTRGCYTASPYGDVSGNGKKSSTLTMCKSLCINCCMMSLCHWFKQDRVNRRPKYQRTRTSINQSLWPTSKHRKIISISFFEPGFRHSMLLSNLLLNNR